MKNKKIIFYVLGLAAIVAAVVLITTNFKKRNVNSDNPEFAKYITAYTSGAISKNSPIQLKLTSAVIDQIKDKDNLPEDLINIRPKVKGTYKLINNEIEFTPAEPLKSDKEFYVEFNLNKLIDVESELEAFNFQFKTIKQAYDYVIEEQKTIDKKTLKYQQVNGYVNTADAADPEKIKDLLKATQEGKKLSVKWSSDVDLQRHFFTIDSIVRKKEASSIKLKWNGDVIDVDKDEDSEIEIPAIGDFKLLSSKVIHNPEQYLQLQFTDPLDEKQNLSGLISIQGVYNLKFVIDDNIIKAYPANRLEQVKKVSVYQGIKNVLGYKLKDDSNFELAFESIKPEVKIVGNGTILPSSDKGLIFPFEAVNLKAVDITIIKIYESNILQFLQNNEIDGSYNLRQVGKPIIRKKVDLSKFNIIDYGVWNRFSLDLSDIIQAEPGAIYRVELNFRKQYSLYQCDEEDSDNAEEVEDSWTEEENESTNWDNYNDGYDYDYYYGYWEDRDNPCKKAYYGNNRKVARNIIASDLGMIAKQSNNNNINVFVTDLQTTKPKAGASVEIFDYQQQLLASGETDNEGKVNLGIIKDPYFAVAKIGKQRAYLKLSDGNSLSLSRFDISGEEVKEGIKGFIYGERGVWRPGDKIYLTYILKDDLNSIPDGHPIVFEFKNPQGQIIKKEVQTKNNTNFYSFRTETESDAVTGNYSLKVSVGSVDFYKTVKVETIKPNRLKIALDFGKKMIKEGMSESTTLNVKWLHGAIAKDLKVKVEGSLQPITTKFDKYSDYTFDDPTKNFYSSNEVLLNAKTDANGDVQLTADFTTDNEAPGMMNAVFFTKAFEKGGNFSVDQYTVKYSPYVAYTGIKLPKGDKMRGMLLTDKQHKVEVVTLTPEGRVMKESHKIKMKFYKLSWRWWFDASSNTVSSYNFRNSSTLLKEAVITSSGGKANWNIDVKYPDWGRYLVIAEDMQTGHSTGKIVYIDWPGWAGRAQKGDSEGATMLSFISDKDKYNVGEEAKITIPTGKDGRALISIEDGTDVLKSYWVQTQEGETEFKFKLTKKMTPNVYVHVSLLQAHSQTANDLPIRMYGTIPIMVEDPDTKLEPVITMPDEIESGKDFTVTVSEKNKKGMTYTLAIVDEGLLDITRFKTPNPWDKFFAKEALGVKTWDMFNEVIGADAGQIERLLAIGGGGEEEGQKNKKANRFKPVVKFLGPFTIGSGDKKTHNINIDKYIGSVRTMVIAGNDKAYGSSEKAVPVIKPLMIIGTLPRILSPGETVKLPASIFAMKSNIKNVTVKVKTNGLFTVNGESSKTLRFDKPGEENVNFELTVNNTIGLGTVELIASSGDKTSTYSIEIDVRNPNHLTTNVIEKVLTAGETWQTNYTPTGIAGTNNGVIEVSSIPPINLKSRLDYLIQYPHGCVEQTTSSVFPQLYVSNLIELNSKQKTEIEKNIKAGIKRLNSFQLSNGGFSYWQGGTNASIWGTNYAGHFLVEAKKKGYPVSSSTIQSWRKYQKNKAKKWTNDGSSSQLVQAYRLYTLALAGYAEKSAMNRMKNISNLSSAAKWRLAAAYYLAGKRTTAENMIANLTTDVTKYIELSYTYGTDLRDKAMILETLTLLGKKARAFKLLKEISDELSSKKYLSTQTTAYSLIAASLYAENNTISGALKYQYSLNSGSMKNVSVKKSISQTDMNIKGTKAGNITIKNTSSSILYARIILQGVPEVGTSQDSQKDLKMTVKYTLTDGSYLSPKNIPQGTDFVAEVTVTHPGILKAYKEVALSQIFPSGWEIINTRLYNVGSSSYTATPENIDIRDDRVYTYFDLARSKSKTFKVLLNASYAGKFWMPPTYCETMYDASIYSQKGGMYVTVE
ncbi:MAG: MG2 domain-containing protein [Bacteroidales bacterium]|nr:MG2 domain-containing protein [Bacteroidales bacterium]